MDTKENNCNLLSKEPRKDCMVRFDNINERLDFFKDLPVAITNLKIEIIKLNSSIMLHKVTWKNTVMAHIITIILSILAISFSAGIFYQKIKQFEEKVNDIIVVAIDKNQVQQNIIRMKERNGE